LTILGIGGMAGIGAGLAYIVPIAVCIRWFPQSQGLVTGIAVAGFGGGAALVSQVGGILIHSFGYTPFETFTAFGILFLCLVICAGSVMRFPPAETGSDQPQTITAPNLRPGQVLGNPPFQLLYLAMFMGLAAGFAVNANLKEIFQSPGNAASIGITAVSLFALCNAAGRVIWGSLFDRISAATAIQANLFCQAGVLAAAPFLASSVPGFWAFAMITGFNYGGVLVIYVSSAARTWGSHHISRVYGWLFTANIPAALSPIAAGFVFDIFNDFTPALAGLAGLLGLMALVIRHKSDLINRRS
jgi:OFA family oxalate/formate antiporter-like MFS transporter